MNHADSGNSSISTGSIVNLSKNECPKHENLGGNGGLFAYSDSELPGFPAPLTDIRHSQPERGRREIPERKVTPSYKRHCPFLAIFP
ncbi:MAG: hypothetical protein JSS02_07920 [Planctomycetes bacterium]|nr:hypothetical protein [Planctomycetota bacterium]